MWSRPRLADRAPPPRRRQRGFALLLVIWVISLLAVLATSLLTDTRTQTLLVRNSLESARAGALAEAGVSLAINGLLDPNSQSRWPADGRERDISYDGGTIRVVITDENGKIDLNLASLEVLAGLFASRGLEPDLRASLLAEIDRRRSEASRSALPLLSGRQLLPANAPTPKAFNSVQELGSLPGLSRATFDRVLPFLTVYSQSGFVNPLTAPREVLEAIPGIDPPEVEALLAAQATPPGAAGGTAPTIPANLTQYLGQTAFSAATITATGVTAGGTTFVREAIVEVTNAPTQPYRIVEWRQPTGGS